VVTSVMNYVAQRYFSITFYFTQSLLFAFGVAVYCIDEGELMRPRSLW
jgi:hypothetical protein